MTPEAHWWRLSERGFELPVAIFDMDGVLSDATHRQEFLRCEPPDWVGFGRTAHLDPPLPDGHREMARWSTDHLAVVVTARSEDMADLTIDWFRRHDFAPDLLIMRPGHDRRPSHQLKFDALERMRGQGAEVRVAYEDERRNLEMYEAAGIEAIYVHSGYYETGPVDP